MCAFDLGISDIKRLIITEMMGLVHMLQGFSAVVIVLCFIRYAFGNFDKKILFGKTLKPEGSDIWLTSLVNQSLVQGLYLML